VFDLILLKNCMILQDMILKLNVSLNLAYISFCVALSFLLVLVYLLVKVILNAFLQVEKIPLAFLLHTL